VPSVFDRSGLAALSDLESPEWRELFDFLESEQASFLENEREFWNPAYKWARDPLHTWSRLWEYPYVFHHLQHLRKSLPGDRSIHVVDFGSGITFLPFSVARLGFHVTCVDTDPIAVESVERAAQCVDTGHGAVRGLIAGAEGAPLSDGAADIVYCVSVLEHVADVTRVLREIARVLSPGGNLVLTTDIDLQGDSSLGIQARTQVVQALAGIFDWVCPDRTVHPADLLTSDRSPYPYDEPWSLPKAWFFAKQRAKGLIGRRPSPHLVWLAVEGFVLQKRG
jgi:2-polyprenyl-3-methyl-5-hydroxy-6-metoxy-1,4-benzoquinol methylase